LEARFKALFKLLPPGRVGGNINRKGSIQARQQPAKRAFRLKLKGFVFIHGFSCCLRFLNPAL
jgi:hypothetical protein